MSDQGDEDGDLREALARRSVTTSGGHDSAVIRAAEDVAQHIRGRGPGATAAPARWTRWGRPLAIAAALVGALYVVFDASLTPAPGPVDVSVRGAAATDVVPQHRSTLRELPIRFGWPVQTSATGYLVMLRDADANPVWNTGSLLLNEAFVPGDLRDRLEVGATYLWTVEVEGPVAEDTLGPFWFRVAD